MTVWIHTPPELGVRLLGYTSISLGQYADRPVVTLPVYPNILSYRPEDTAVTCEPRTVTLRQACLLSGRWPNKAYVWACAATEMHLLPQLEGWREDVPGALNDALLHYASLLKSELEEAEQAAEADADWEAGMGPCERCASKARVAERLKRARDRYDLAREKVGG